MGRISKAISDWWNAKPTHIRVPVNVLDQWFFASQDIWNHTQKSDPPEIKRRNLDLFNSLFDYYAKSKF